ncbi:MAG TPA: hypothetical protein PK718_01930 [Candidatus Methanofastidiosa archaeon]|nr:hypothetical protein [Candidatus Methanofastidiosa archaeon]HPR41290.1 hypothetical protein [Candidatus Methanofastidiosa archaeon]
MVYKLVLVLALILSLQTLEPPSDLSVELDGDTAILTWQDNSVGEEGFWIYRDRAKHAKVPADTTYYEDDISDNTRHYYMVSAYNGDEESSLSNEVNVRSEGVSTRIIYYGLPLLALIVVIVFFLGRGKKDEDDYEQDDEPVLLTDRLTKF